MTPTSLIARALPPLWLLARASEPLLKHIRIDEAWEQAVRRGAERGSLVYVLRNVSIVDLVALDYLTRRLGLPRIGFANEIGSLLEGPLAGSRSEAQRLRAALSAGRSAALFMKRAPSVLASGTHRGRSEGDELLRTLCDVVRSGERQVVLMPQTFVWTQRPQERALSLVDALFGPADFPGELRAAAQFLLNHRNCVLRAGEPLLLADFVAQAGGEPDVRQLTYALLRKVERERRAILGPAHKPADRVREEVLKSPKLSAIVRDLAGPGEHEQALLTDKARAMLRGLQADPDPQALKGLELLADRLIDRVYNGVDVDVEGLERLREAAQRGAVVLLPSHKSHVDYLLLSYVLRKNALQTPVIAAGDNLAFFPLGPVFRRAGAFFIRRSFKGDRLYAAVVDAYVRRLLRDGWAIEFFLEGGRSRTGKVLPPMLGLLNMVVDAALGLEGRVVSFVPVSIGYERMMEEGAFAHEVSGGAKRKEDAAALLDLLPVLQQKYGRANVQIGTIVELDALRGELALPDSPTPAKRRSLVTRLGHRVMSEINRATLVTPGSLVATVLLCHRRRGLPHVELVEQCARLLGLVRRLGARTAPSLVRGAGGELRPQAIRDAALVYVHGGLVRQHVPGDTLTGASARRARIYTGDDVIYTVPDDKRLALDLSKNHVVHFFVDRALVSVAVLSLLRGGGQGGLAPRAEVAERVHSLSRLFKLEFMFRADAPFERILDETLADMIAAGELADDGGALGLGAGHAGLDGRGWVTFYASVLRNFLESYRIAARTARVLVKGPLPIKEIVTRALRVGEQMFLGGEIERAEAVCGPVLENAFAAFVEQGYLVRSDGRLELAESFASDEAALAVEARVAGYLSRRAGEGGW